MYLRGIMVGLVLLFWLPVAGADKLQVAARGKKQTVLPHYGNLSSFDGTTLVFDELGPSIGTNSLQQNIMGGAQTVPMSFPAKDTVIVIELRVRNPQEAVDGNHIESSRLGEPKDVDLQRAQLQQQQPKKAAETDAAEFDLTRCSPVSIDQVVERDPQASGKTKPPVLGNVQNIANGVVTFQRKSDRSILKYRLDALTEIKMGMCQ
jgi:hypothetical protein